MAKKPRKKSQKSRAKQAGRGGNIPPVEYRWKKGQSGNPAGSKNFGATVGQWYNAMVDYPRPELERIAGDPSEGSAKVSAAQQVLQARKGKLDSLIEVCDRTDGSSVKRSINAEVIGMDSASMDELAARLLERGFTIEQLPAELRERAKRVESRVIESKGGAK